MKQNRYPLLCLLAIASLFSSLNSSVLAQESPLPQVNQDIEALLLEENLHINGVRILTQSALQQVYADHEFAPYWTRPERVRELMTLIKNADDHGLNPNDYLVNVLLEIHTRLSRSPSAQLQAKEDILLTESLVRYGYHRRYGKVKASSFDPDINFRREAFRNQSSTRTMEEAMESSSLTDFIQLAAPSGPVYLHLQQALKDYRAIAATGGWPTVSDGPTLRLGDTDPRVDEIRQRLKATGWVVSQPAADPQEFDESLKEAVKAFQAVHSLDDDGIVGKQTIQTMNIPIEVRIDQLRLSLERIRWVNQEAADTLVAVNIAGFRAFFYQDGNLEWTTRAMVGKHYRKTPVFRGEIAYLEFNPTWTIPPGIMRNDTLPAIKKDPNYLASKNIRVIDRDGKFIDPSTVDWNQYTRGVPYTLRQDPGPWNSLGTVKFIFPNEHFVFLHDTPHRELFDRTERAFSSGCIRIEYPLTLAELILDDPQKYAHSQLEGIVESRETIRISPEETIAVLIIYLTASVDPDGKVRFFKDIYDRDASLLDILNGPVIIDPPTT